ncbi:hypothetical protein NKJ59_03570 [Mesorhizobium australicum]|uniref:hypothetical protein n=1 Tax=Mesorhizobium australicum TaxID=536018 RepID=UPI00333587AE
MHGIAMLDGKEFDLDEILGIERQLSGLASAEGEQMRRQRMEAANAEAERLDNVRATLSVVEEHRLEAVERAEKAARDLCEALKEVRARAADGRHLIRALGGSGYPLEENEQEFRMAVRLSCALKPLTGIRARFGQIVFPAARAPFDNPWRDEEAKIVSHDISKALKGASE